MRLSLAGIGAAIVFPAGSIARAQLGGTGVDGPFVPTSNVTLDANPTNGGIFQFTDVYIGPGITVTCTGPLPVQVYATGDIVIDGMAGFSPGRLVADAGAGSPGSASVPPCPPAPGGFATNGGWAGGNGGCSTPNTYPTPGGGPGGGSAGGGSATPGQPSTPGYGGPAYPALDTTLSLSLGSAVYGTSVNLGISASTLLLGGSGGGGYWGPSGGGGGGCILLSAAGTVTIRGVLSALGGDAVGSCAGGGGGGNLLLRGSQGVLVDALGLVTASGGGSPWSLCGGGGYWVGGLGHVRFEAPSGSLAVMGSVVGVQSTGAPPPPAQSAANTQVFFNGIPATSVSITGLHGLAVTTPVLPPGWYDVTISDPVTPAALPHSFVVKPALEASVAGGALTGGTVTITLTATQYHWETVYVGLVLLPVPIPLSPIGYVQWIDGLIAPAIAGLNPNANGVVTATVPFPPSPSALGLSVYLQGIDVVTPFPLIATLTNPVTVTF